MPLTSGTRLGPYDIIAPLGAGGMGEVYKARDSRLNRDVAVKVLPESFAADPERRARFEREARAVAALSHGNILAIFDTGVDAGRMFVVTELLEGETLRAQLERGPLPVRKAIDIGVQLARGLAAAHDKGLVHRDLKPENIFLLRDGQAKILDFGLAQRPEPAGAGDSETVAALTDPGMVMGTIGYTAPEQVRGLQTDARTDLFALGAVLYEMLTGRRAFKGESNADTMSAIVRDEPAEVATLRQGVPPALERIVRHCLEKNPNERFQTARDVAFALEALSGTQVSSTAMPVLPSGRGWRVPALMAAVAIVAAAAAMFVDWRLAPSAEAISFETKTWDSEWITNARFGADGQTIIFSAATSGNVPELFAIRPGTVTSQRLGQGRTHLLAVSSKGELAVLTDAVALHHRIFKGTLARMSIDGAPRPWLEHVLEADWSPDGSTLALVREVKGRAQLEYPIGKMLYDVGGALSDLRVSPDGTQVAFFEHQIASDDRGWVKVVDDKGSVRLLAGEYWGEEGLAWSPDGRFVLFSGSRDGGEAYQPLSVNAKGTPVVRQAVSSAGAMYVQDIAPDGRMLVTRTELHSSIRGLVPGETAEREFPWLDYAESGQFSRDGKFLLFGDESQSAGANYAVALRDLSSGRVVRLGEGGAAALSPDGKWAAALIPSTEQIALYPIGAGEGVKLPRGPLEHILSLLQWSSDGRRVIYCGNERGKGPRCYEQEIPGGLPKPITPEGIRVVLPSPDERRLLTYSSAGEFGVMPRGGSISPVRGFTMEDTALAWIGDSAVAAEKGAGLPARIERVDLQSGARTLLKEISPPDPAGINNLDVTQWIDGGRGYVYGYTRELSKLFVAKGVTAR